MNYRKGATRAGLLASISLLPALASFGAQAQEVEELIVTGTRRSATVQDSPINITAIGGAEIEQQGFSDLTEALRFVPGVFTIDAGPRQGNPIVVRGLNAAPTSFGDGNNSGNGTVATYVGEIPLFIDLKLNDMERVEVLLGPQGTLYGAGTLGGAIRYIPTRPKFGETGMSVRGDAYGYSSGSKSNIDVGTTFNIPVGDKFAIRGSVDWMDDRGFIDQPFVVNRVGVSDPNDLTDANVSRRKDTNTEKALSGRLGLRWAPIEALDVNLTYYYQDQQVGGRQVSSRRLDNMPYTFGKYESASRVLEPNRIRNEMLALEITADLGFAELTSATGQAIFKSGGQRDQTDLLIGLEYSYEAFPGFSAFTREEDREETFNQEVRLVSKYDSPLSWILGGFYNRFKTKGFSKEFTPGYDVFNGGSRPDSLEYYSLSRSVQTETAGYGELSYQITPKWQVTGGARYYRYELDFETAIDLPLYYTVFDGRGPDSIVLDWEPDGQENKGWLFKANTSYDLSDDLKVYFTYSEGNRIGGPNGVAACPTPLPTSQIVCALPNEAQFGPDQTTNFELGLHSQWLDKRLTFNGALYYIEYKDPQVNAATVNGQQPITRNGGKAETKGFEVNFNWLATERFRLRGAYSYADAKFTETTPNLISYIVPPGFNSTIAYEDGEDGDRLPGSPKHQGSLFASYTQPLSNGWDLEFGYGVTAAGNVLTRTGGKGGGITLPSYDLHNAQVTLQGEQWSASLYATNLFNEFAEVSARSTPLSAQVVENADGGPVYSRSFGTGILAPRRIGIRFTRSFGGV
ncbi:TonB-dependent receptor [Caulobacter sp. NIBR2454]|uniref:TonB-dependent receptor n=1 Tax=Caulobacter sp. NIBR2454 TaxID=3015996 RepID=UPI0022B6330A|nr:TonB-dependent receptor [Caulobacter sp. NIBR2454]